MNELREAAQAALKEMEHANAVLLRQAGVGIIDMNAISRLRSALAKPEETTRDKWRDVVIGALEICCVLSDANRADPERAISDLMGWEPRDGWRPADGKGPLS